MQAKPSMAEKTRQFIAALPRGSCFATKKLLHLGTRTVIDKVVCALVKAGILKRLARGVFWIPDPFGEHPTKFHIARAKAEAFGKAFHLMYNEELAKVFNIREPDPSGLTICTTGGTSSFATVRGRVYWRHVAPRKLELGASKGMTALRAVWHMCKNSMSDNECAEKLRPLLESEGFTLRRHIGFLPARLSDKFVDLVS